MWFLLLPLEVAWNHQSTSSFLPPPLSPPRSSPHPPPSVSPPPCFSSSSSSFVSNCQVEFCWFASFFFFVCRFHSRCFCLFLFVHLVLVVSFSLNSWIIPFRAPVSPHRFLFFFKDGGGRRQTSGVFFCFPYFLSTCPTERRCCMMPTLIVVLSPLNSQTNKQTTEVRIINTTNLLHLLLLLWFKM